MPSGLAKERAGQAWTMPMTSHIPMDVDLAEAFAEILDDILEQPWLGNATNEQLLDELKARFEVNGQLYYATAKCEDQPTLPTEVKRVDTG